MKIIIIAAIAVTAYGQSSFGTDAALSHKATSTLEIPGHFYVIEVECSGSTVEYATYPPSFGSAAAINVSEVIGGAKHKVWKEMYGELSGCYSLSPVETERYIQKAYDNACDHDPGPTTTCVPPDVASGLAKLREDAAYAALQPYSLSDHVLYISKKGVNEINEVKVDGVSVWKNPKPVKDISITGTGTISIGMVTLSSNCIAVDSHGIASTAVDCHAINSEPIGHTGATAPIGSDVVKH